MTKVLFDICYYKLNTVLHLLVNEINYDDSK